MVETKQVADALLTAAVVGIGVVVGGPVAAVVGGIGINWASELTRKGWEQACCQLVGKRGPRNHDLQQAMARGFENAINGIEQGWWQTTRGNQIRRQEPESAKAIKESFKLLREEAQALFVDDQQERTSSDLLVRDLLAGDPTTLSAKLSQQVTDFLHGHDQALVAFVNERLLNEVEFCFNEELKADTPEGERAWRAFQRLMLESMRDSLGRVEASQVESQQTLQTILALLQQSAVPAAAKSVIPVPPPARHLVGRDLLLTDLVDDLTSRQKPLIALQGLPGSGKTSLALAMANRAEIAQAFPDGRAWLPLGPQPDLFSVLGRLLEQFGVPSKDLPDAETRTDRLRTDLAGKRYLLVLDDVWVAGDARPFLEAVQPPAAVVLTTRNRQIVADCLAVEREIRDLDAEAAIEMLAVAGVHAAAAIAADRAASQALIQATGSLPLALHVAGRRLERLARADGAPGAAARLLQELSAQASRILEWQTAEGRAGLKDAEQSLAAIVQLSYDSLPTPRAQRAFRCLAVFGGQPLTFDEAAMAAVWEADKYTATDLRLALADAGLLERVEIGLGGENEDSGPIARIEPQHALHQVIAMFAAAKLTTGPDEAYAAHLAHARHYTSTVSADDNSMIAGDLAALARLDLALGQVRRAIAWAKEQNTREARQALRDLVIAMRNYAIEARTLYAEYDAWLAPALTACRTLNDPSGEVFLLKAQGDTLLKTERREEAEGWYREALMQAKRTGDEKVAADALLALGGLAQFRGQLSDAREAYELALDLYVDVENRHGQANALADIGSILVFEQHLEEAESQYQKALDLYRQVGDLLGQANMLLGLGDALCFREQTETVSAALERYAAASDLYRVLGNPQYRATVLHRQGSALAFLGRRREALSALEEALRMNRELGSPLGEANVLAAIGTVVLVDGEQERADQLLDEAIAIYEEVDDPYSIAARIGDYGWALHYAGQPDRARPYFLRAAELFDEYGYPEYATRHREMIEK